jgi:Domain of unknown function (DUF222)
VTAAAAAHGRPPGPGDEDRWPGEDRWLADDSWGEDPEPPPAWLDENPWPGDDPGLAGYPWWADDPAEAGAGRPGPVEVWKAGRWDRSAGDGGGFAAGGVGDRLAPGAVLAGLAGDRWADGLGALSDDELIGVLRAARRLASWAAAMELAAVGDLWRRRVAEEDAGDTGAAVHADDEIAAALTLTRHAADQVLDLAITLGRLPRTATALALGDIDLPRAKVLADEVTGLSAAHAAAVEEAVIAAAAGQTTGQLRAAARRAVLAADPAAARIRKEEAQRQARVERWTEPAGTAALAGRDLPPASVLAADANLTALATQLKAAGVPGTMDILRAQVYLALLTGAPVTSLLPAGSNWQTSPDRAQGQGSGDRGGHTSHGAAPTGSVAGSPPPGSPVPGSSVPAAASGCLPSGVAWPGAPAGALLPFGGLTGSVNLTIPLATWLGLADAPSHASGYGPLDATDSRGLAAALAAQASTQWCLTVTGPDGRAVAHGCARAGPSPGRRRSQAGTGTNDQPAAGSRDRPTARSHGGSAGGSRDGPEKRPPGRAWTFTITWLGGAPPGSTPRADGCDHARETAAYQPSPRLRHLVQIRHATCTFPGCRRPAAQCDADHTLAYHHGGRTCLCNLAPLCRHHHQVKQARGWALAQASPGVMTWTTPAGRRYTTTPTGYPT